MLSLGVDEELERQISSHWIQLWDKRDLFLVFGHNEELLLVMSKHISVCFHLNQ